MTKITRISLVVSSTFLLAGCSIFYPNWGATSLPEEPTVSETVTVEPEPSESTSPTPSESATPERPKKKEAEVEVMFFEVLPDEGILSVVAEMSTAAESGGSCTLKFISGSTQKSFTVKSEPSSTYTQCAPFEIKLAELVSGNGIFTVSYESDTYQGQSVTSSVVIP